MPDKKINISAEPMTFEQTCLVNLNKNTIPSDWMNMEIIDKSNTSRLRILTPDTSFLECGDIIMTSQNVYKGKEHLRITEEMNKGFKLWEQIEITQYYITSGITGLKLFDTF